VCAVWSLTATAPRVSTPMPPGTCPAGQSQARTGTFRGTLRQVAASE
jgi:hypothetical protein